MAKENNNEELNPIKPIEVDFEETSSSEKTLDITDEESIRDRLLNRNQPSSMGGNTANPSKNNEPTKEEPPNSSQANPKDENKDKNEEKSGDKSDRQKAREKRDADHSNRQNNPQQNNANSNQTDNPINKLQSAKDSLENPLKGNSKSSGASKNAARNSGSKASQKAAKKTQKKAAKEVKKAAKKAAKKAEKKVVAKGIAAVGKLIAALAGYIGLPVIAVVVGIIVLIVILMVASSIILGTGKDIDEFGEEAKELREYIVEASDNTIDKMRPEQYPYRVPEELLASVVQLDSYLAGENKENDGSMDAMKKLIQEFADSLKPEFTYKKYTEWTKVSTLQCVEFATKHTADGQDQVGDCTKQEWSAPVKTEHEVEKLIGVRAWNGKGKFIYEPVVSDWSESGTTRVQTMTYELKDTIWDYDFEKLDEALNSHNYKLEDKKWFEFFFESAAEREIYYIKWLETGKIPANANLDFDPYEGDFLGDFAYDGSIIPGAGVPEQYMPMYLAGQQKYGVPWYALAAIHWKETTFSTHPTMVSSVGAIGHVQFMPCTWMGWNYPGCTRLGSIPGASEEFLSNLKNIKKYGGFGVDGDGDGKAQPSNIWDAILTAANYLSSSGFKTNPQKAVYAYNHDPNYVSSVLAKAEEFKNAAKSTGGGDNSTPVNAAGSNDFERVYGIAKQFYGYPYVWGGNKPSTSFDCSGLTQYSYKVGLGINLPRTAYQQYNYTKRISKSEVRPGDLVFFKKGNRAPITHVGMYIGNGKMINAVSAGTQNSEVWGSYWNPYYMGAGRVTGFNP